MAIGAPCPMVDEIVDYREDTHVESGTVVVFAEASALAPEGGGDAAVADSSTSAPVETTLWSLLASFLLTSLLTPLFSSLFSPPFLWLSVQILSAPLGPA